MSDETTINANPYNNNIYEMMYIDLNGKMNQVKKNIWTQSDKFDAIGDNVVQISPNIIVSKITQLNTGEYLFLGTNCNVYKMDSNLKNPTIINTNTFTGLTQLSNYKILLTRKDGKMYIVDDVNKFDSTGKQFFDDGTVYCSVKQTFDGYIVAIDGTQCGTAWRFDLDLINGQLKNKTKINLDDTFTNRVTLFSPDQKSLFNLNCNSRYQDRVYRYDYTDKTIKSKYDFKCGDGEVYESFNNKCYRTCPSGYSTNPSDIVSCWSQCNSGDITVGALCRTGCKTGFHDIAGVCWNDKKLTYDIGVGIAPSYSCPNGYQLEGLKCIKNPPDGYKRLQGDYTTYWLDQPTSYTKGSKQSDQDNSACNGLTNNITGVGTCTGWDACNTKPCTKLCKSCTYDNYTWGCDAGRCGRNPDICVGNTCLPVTSGGGCHWDGCCSRSDRNCTDWGFGNQTCVGGDCIGCARCDPVRTDPCGARTPTTCSPGAAKCCDTGIKTSLTGINCDKCGTYDSCTCIGGVVTRNAPRSCPSGYSFDSSDLTKTLCYEDCKDGYESRPGDIISCWNKKPTSITIPLSNTINATPSCLSDREYRDLMCYKKCDPGYVAAATNCSLPTGDQSYVPETYPRKTVSRGNPSDPGVPGPITCNDKCCMFDLTFYNPAFVKPNTLALPQIPITNGLIGYYDANSFANGIWYDLTQFNNHATQIKGSFVINKTFITGTLGSSILFPFQILPSTYTVFNVSKYIENSKSNGKILAGYNSKWYSGFAKGLSGISGRDLPITQTKLSAFDNKWVFSTDTNTTYRANGTNYTTNNSNPINTSAQLSINLNHDNSENSDFAISCLIVFDRTLSLSEINQIESWLSLTYANLWSLTYTKTFAQLGYSCFDNKIGKVTNDYKSYSLASYKSGPLGCEWLDLPEKNDFDALTCESTLNLKYEKFTSMDISMDISFDFLFYLLVIIFVIVLVFRINNKK